MGKLYRFWVEINLILIEFMLLSIISDQIHIV